VPIPASGRTFRTRYRIRLSDMDETGRLRLDAVARFLQDAATDDVEETGWGAPEHLWVIRAVRIEVLEPFVEDVDVDVVTWGSSFSALAAGRRWSLRSDAGGSIEVDSTWIHLDRNARPARIGEGFDDYAAAAGGRVAATRLTLSPPSDGTRVPWPLRSTDVDLMGHVNNAAYWTAVEHRLSQRGIVLRGSLSARLEYRHPIDLGESVELVDDIDDDGYAVAFAVEGAVKAVSRLDWRSERTRRGLLRPS
jgi:acyl-ACP thioesterase